MNRSGLFNSLQELELTLIFYQPIYQAEPSIGCLYLTFTQTIPGPHTNQHQSNPFSILLVYAVWYCLGDLKIHDQPTKLLIILNLTLLGLMIIVYFGYYNSTLLGKNIKPNNLNYSVTGN